MKSAALLTGLGLLASLGLASPVTSEYTSVREAPFGYKPGSKESIENLKDKVENIVWLILENRFVCPCVGHMLNEQRLPGFQLVAREGKH